MRIGTDAGEGASGLSRWVSAHAEARDDGDKAQASSPRRVRSGKLTRLFSSRESHKTPKPWIEVHAAALEVARDAVEGRSLGVEEDGTVRGGWSGTQVMEPLPGELIVGKMFHQNSTNLTPPPDLNLTPTHERTRHPVPP